MFFGITHSEDSISVSVLLCPVSMTYNSVNVVFFTHNIVQGIKCSDSSHRILCYLLRRPGHLHTVKHPRIHQGLIIDLICTDIFLPWTRTLSNHKLLIYHCVLQLFIQSLVFKLPVIHLVVITFPLF